MNNHGAANSAPANAPSPIVDNAVYSLIRQRAEATPDAILGFDEHDRSMTFGEYHEKVLAVAAALIDAGVTPRSRVGWQLTTSFEALVLAGALSRLGVCQVLLLPSYRIGELEHIVGQARPEVLIVSGKSNGYDHVGLANEVKHRFPALKIIRLEDVAAESATPLPHYLPPEPQEMRWLIYTSGTTGAPKGVMHSDSSVIAGARASYVPLEVTPSDCQTLNFAFAHIGGIMMLCAQMATGCSSVLVERFDADAHVPLYRRHHVTLAGSGPPFFRMYLAVQRKTPGKSILPDVRYFQGAGSPKTPTMHDELKSEIGGHGIFSAYGMSECPMLTVVTVDSPDRKKALTDGRPAIETQIRLVDSRGADVPQGEEGQVLVKGPQLFLGYLDSSLNAEAFDTDGFYRTGDLARFDEEGYLRLTGRLKDLIIRKGENISPREIEDHLSLHPKVGEVAIIGVPDEERGEMCVAAVINKDPGRPLEFDEMIGYLKEAGLATHKIPERLETYEEFPKNVGGKVLKNVLRAQLAPVT